MARQLTRQTLFDLIWQTPMKQLAVEFGVTPQAVSKVCDQYEIPKPGYGYWTLREMGRPLEKPALDTTARSGNEIILIEAGQRANKARPPQVVPRTERPKLVTTKPETTASEIFSPEPLDADALPSEVHSEPTGGVPENVKLRPLRKTLERAKPNEKGYVQAGGKGTPSISIGKASIDRAISWISSLIAQAERAGASFQLKDGAMAIVFDGEVIGFHLEEKPDRTPHTPTSDELAKKARWGDVYSPNWKPWPKYDHRPSGKLALVFDTNSYSGLRRSFSDGATQSLESLHDEILVAFATHAAAVKESRRKAEIAQRQAEIARLKRERLKAFQEREERREKFIGAIADALTRRARLAGVAEHLRIIEEDGPGPIRDMIGWLERRLAETDALLSPTYLDLSCRSAKLDFDEQRAGAAKPEPSWYYPHAVELQLWSIDKAKDRATSQTPFEWAVEAGFIAEPPADPPD